MVKKENKDKGVNPEELSEEQMAEIQSDIAEEIQKEEIKPYFDYSIDDGLSEFPEAIKWEEDKQVLDVVEGKVIRIGEVNYEGRPTQVCELELYKTKESVSVWLVTVLKSKFERLKIKEGDFVGIQYLGRVKGKRYLDFKVFKA